jgi:hypothetical protein
VGAVEDGDLAAARQLALAAPQEVVGELLGRRRLERADHHALRVQAVHDVADHAVLARCVQSLDDDDQAVGLLRGQPVLALGEQLHALRERSLRRALRDEVRGEAGVEVVRQPHPLPGPHAQRLQQALGIGAVGAAHESSLPCRCDRV